ncbi:MAG: methyltransferase domain-containing protein [Planctomycetes bacterium]|nr:methyltransferase domain-containing protein [Planctomycetota bacterium]
MADFSRGRARQPKPQHQARHDGPHRQAQGGPSRARPDHRDTRKGSFRQKQRDAAERGPRSSGVGPRSAPHPRSAHGPDPRKLGWAVLRRVSPGDVLEGAVLAEFRHQGLDTSMLHRVLPMLEDASRFGMLFDHLIGHVATRPAGALDADVRAALHLYLAWFLLDDPKAVYAHGQAAVDLLSDVHTARGFVNACVRRLSELLKVENVPPDDYRAMAAAGKIPEFWRDRCRLGAGRITRAERAIFADFATAPATHLAQTCGLPEDFVNRLIEQHGLNAACMVALSAVEKTPTWLRANTLKTSPEGLKHILSLRGIEATQQSRAIALPVGTRDFDQLGIFETGLAYVQDFSAQQVAPAVGARQGDKILDLCAAPGGKATHLAELTTERAKILAVDVSLEKIERIQENIARLGYTSIATAAADALTVKFPEPFDRVLLDAPCSNSGVLARRVEARHRLTPGKLKELGEMQRKMLENAAANLKPGGTLVYSVCSVLMEEGMDVTRAFIEARQPGTSHTREDGGWAIEEEKVVLPVPAWHDGTYFCRLKAP